MRLGRNCFACHLLVLGLRCDEYDAFRDARAHRRAVEWLADNSLIADDAATGFLDEHPEPNVP